MIQSKRKIKIDFKGKHEISDNDVKANLSFAATWSDDVIIFVVCYMGLLLSIDEVML
jgi:hypothetical protein